MIITIAGIRRNAVGNMLLLLLLLSSFVSFVRMDLSAAANRIARPSRESEQTFVSSSLVFLCVILCVRAMLAFSLRFIQINSILSVRRSQSTIRIASFARRRVKFLINIIAYLLLL